jgi:hypothetical protein
VKPKQKKEKEKKKKEKEILPKVVNAVTPHREALTLLISNISPQAITSTSINNHAARWIPVAKLPRSSSIFLALATPTRPTPPS